MSRDAASPETVPREIIDETIIQDTPERRLAVLGEIDEAYGRDVRRRPRQRGRARAPARQARRRGRPAPHGVADGRHF